MKNVTVKNKYLLKLNLILCAILDGFYTVIA